MSVKKVRSKYADLNKNVASCSDGRARYVVTKDKIMKCSDSGKLERFTEASLGQHTVNEKSSSFSLDHINKIDDCLYSVKSKKQGRWGSVSLLAAAILTATAEPAIIKAHDTISINAAVNKQIKMKQLITVDVVGDGNCFFQAVAMSVYGDQSRYV